MLGLVLTAILALPASDIPATPPPPQEVLAVPAELRTLLYERVVRPVNSEKGRLDRLTDFIFSDAGLHIEYDATSTTTVEQAFQTRKANCLGMTLLAIALAREAGLEAYGQEMDRVLAWDLNNGTVTQNIHANAGIMAGGRHFVIDVSTNDLLVASFPRRISDERLLALYYNNRAMELMAQGRLGDTKTWLDFAMQNAPDHPMLWSNAGVLSLRNGDVQQAEADFRKALQLNPGQSSALFNMAGLYRRIGDMRNAKIWQAHADQQLRRDPFQQFMLGYLSEQAGDYAAAIKHYRIAIRLDDGQHLFHFGLARTLLHLGQSRSAGIELQRAHDLSAGATQGRYQAKLEALHRMRLN